MSTFATFVSTAGRTGMLVAGALAGVAMVLAVALFALVMTVVLAVKVPLMALAKRSDAPVRPEPQVSPASASMRAQTVSASR